MSIKEKAVKGIVWSAIQNWGSQAGSLLVFFILARLLTPDAFGLVALANIFLALMQIFVSQGFAQALIQRNELEPEHLDTTFWTTIAIGILLTITGFIAAGSVGLLFQQPQLVTILQAFSLQFLITSFGSVQQALLERNLKFKVIAIRSLAGTVIGGSIGVAMALANCGAWSLVGQQLAQEFTSVLLLWKLSDWRPGFKLSFKHFQDIFGFGISISGFNLLNFFSTRADDFLIGYFLGTVALGYYTIAYRILNIMAQLLVSTSNQVALPTFSRLQSEPEKFRQAFYAATQLTSIIAFPVFLGVATLAPEVIVLMFGRQWIPSIPVLQVLCFAGIFKSINFFKSSVFIAMGKASWTLYFGFLNTVLNLIGFALAVKWGIVAVASAYVIRGYLVFPINQWVVTKLIQVPIIKYLQQLITPLLSSLLMAITILIAKKYLISLVNTQILLIICTLLGIIVYGLIIRFCSPKLFDKLINIIYLARSNSKSQI